MANALLKFDDNDLMGDDTEVISIAEIEEDFCQLHVATGVAWTAYRDTIAAYYRSSTHEPTLRKQASLFLARPHIAARVDQIRRETYKSMEITPGKIIREYGKIAFFDIRKLLDKNGNIKPIHELDDDTAASVAGIEFDVTKTKTKHNIYSDENDEEDIGSVDAETVTTTTAKLKLADKTKALDSLSKVLGMHVDKIEHSGPGGQPLDTSPNSAQIARQVAFLLSQGVVEVESQNG